MSEFFIHLKVITVFLDACAKTHFNCKDINHNDTKDCVPIEKVCDGNYDCSNLFDERDELCKGT